MQLNSKKGLVSEINVTPMVDVMLVLLIIFMVAAPMLTEGFPVDLPETKASTALPTDDQNVVLSITKEGNVYLNKQAVTLENLDQVLKENVVIQHKNLFLQADKDVAYGLVVEVMGIAKIAGIDNLGVVSTQPKPKS